MKISSFAWGFVALVILAVIGLGVGAACYLFNDAHMLFGVDALILSAAAVPYFVYAVKQSPLGSKKKDANA